MLRGDSPKIAPANDFFIGAFLCQIDNFKWNSQEDFKTIIHNSWDQRIWIVPRNCCAAVFSLNWQSMGSFLLSSIIALYLIHQGAAGIRFLIFVFTNFFIFNIFLFSRNVYTKKYKYRDFFLSKNSIKLDGIYSQNLFFNI